MPMYSSPKPRNVRVWHAFSLCGTCRATWMRCGDTGFFRKFRGPFLETLHEDLTGLRIRISGVAKMEIRGTERDLLTSQHVEGCVGLRGAGLGIPGFPQ